MMHLLGWILVGYLACLLIGKLEDRDARIEDLLRKR